MALPTWATEIPKTKKVIRPTKSNTIRTKKMSDTVKHAGTCSMNTKIRTMSAYKFKTFNK